MGGNVAIDPRIGKQIDKESYTRGWEDHMHGMEPGEFEKLDMGSYWCGWEDRDVLIKAGAAQNSEDAHDSAKDVRETFRQHADATGEPYGAPSSELNLTPEDLKLLAGMKIKA
jgi:hypothetical protein